MTRKSFLPAVLITAILFAACNQNQSSFDPGAFRFSAVQYDYLGGSALVTAGDSAGIYASAPLSASNVKGIMESSGYLDFSPSIQTIPESTDSSRVCSYMPYKSGLDASKPIFSARKDQSARNGFDASCLYIASAALVSGDNSKATRLEFKPKMALLDIRITNMTEVDIDSVRIGDLKGDVLINISDGSISTTGDRYEFLAWEDADSSGLYKLYLPEQEASILITAVMENGDIHEFEMEASLKAGEYCTNSSYSFIIESEVGPTDPKNFTTITVPGAYSITEDLLTPALVYHSGRDQYACSSTASEYSFRLQNPSEGWMYRIDVSPAQFSQDASVTVTTQAVNCDPLISSTYSATVVQQNETTAWLRCDDAQLGFIIRTK